MTREVATLQRMALALEKLPLDAQYRTLAYLVARTMNVGCDPVSDALYAKSQQARSSGHDRECSMGAGGRGEGRSGAAPS